MASSASAKTGYGAALAAGVLIGVSLCVALQARSSAPEQPQAAKVLRTQRLEIVDQDNRLRATFEGTRTGSDLRLLDQAGGTRARLVLEEGTPSQASPRLHLYGPDSKTGILLDVRDKGDPSVMVFHYLGSQISMDMVGTQPRLLMFGKALEGYASLGPTRGGATELEMRGDRGGSSVLLGVGGGAPWLRRADRDGKAQPFRP